MAKSAFFRICICSLCWILVSGSILFSQNRNQDSEGEEEKAKIEIMDPETMYSFSGIEGKGFLNRSPVNLPQPAYDGEETGIVGLMFTITPAGRVSKVKQETFALTTANAEMIQKAKTAVLQWEFTPLPRKLNQEDQDVRVIIQFNTAESGILYSIDGLYRIEGLKNRFPIELEAPDYNTEHEGIVTAFLAISPEGNVKYIGKFHGAYSYQKVIPKLGLITYSAIKKWRFDPLRPDQRQVDQEIIVKIRYQHLDN